MQGLERALDPLQIADRTRAQDDVFECGLFGIGVDAAKRLVEPCAEIAREDELAFAVHAGVAGVLVPALPD